MSLYGVLNALMAPDLTPAEGKVYAYLVGRSNGSRVCWPEVAHMASDLGMSSRTVMASTKRLKALGRIRVSRRYKDTNNYEIVELPGLYDRPAYTGTEPVTLTADETTSHDSDSDLKKTTPEIEPAEPAVDVKKTAVIEIPTDLKETAVMELWGEKHGRLTCEKLRSDLRKTTQESVHQESNKISTKEEGEARVNALVPVTLSSQVRDDIVRVWNITAEQNGLPRMRVMTVTRERALAKRLKEVGLNGILEAIKAIGSSAFCCGNNNRGWKAGFDFLLQSESLARTLEGKYDNRSCRRKGVFDTIREDLGGASFLTQIFDDEEPGQIIEHRSIS